MNFQHCGSSGDKRQQLLLAAAKFPSFLGFLILYGEQFLECKKSNLQKAFLLLLLLPTHDKKKICLQATICKTGFALIRCLQPLHHIGWKCLKMSHQSSNFNSNFFSKKYEFFNLDINFKSVDEPFSDTFNPNVSLFFPEHHRASRVNKPKTVLLGIDAGFKLLNWPT